jgi:hypothetical protein
VTKAKPPALKNPYQNEQGRPLLRKSVVGWLDILGFRDILEDARARNEEAQVLGTLVDALDVLSELKPLPVELGGIDPPPWVVKAFTDNFVLGFPVSLMSPTEATPELGWILDRVGRFQLALAQQGFVIRGAIAVGPLCMDESLVYGSALIEAYEAETTRARDPRVILTDSAKAVMDKEGERWRAGSHMPPYDAPVWQDVDGELFVNYLAGVVEFERDVGYPDVKTFEQHGGTLRKKLAAYVRHPPKWSKYAWLALPQRILGPTPRLA